MHGTIYLEYNVVNKNVLLGEFNEKVYDLSSMICFIKLNCSKFDDGRRKKSWK